MNTELAGQVGANYLRWVCFKKISTVKMIPPKKERNRKNDLKSEIGSLTTVNLKLPKTGRCQVGDIINN